MQDAIKWFLMELIKKLTVISMAGPKLNAKKIAEIVIRPSSAIHTGYLLHEMTNLTLYWTLHHQVAFLSSLNFLCNSICWPLHTGKLGHFPSCTADWKISLLGALLQAMTVLLPLCLSKFLLLPVAHLSPPLNSLPWWDEYTTLGLLGFLNTNYPTPFCV